MPVSRDVRSLIIIISWCFIIVFFVIVPLRATFVRMQYIPSKIEYIKDTRTGICFAIVNNNPHSLTAVPCDSVNHLLH